MSSYREVAFIALGSNLGDPRQTILQAFDRLSLFSVGPILRSSLWQTEPVDCPPGAAPFVNAAAGINLRAGETPEALLRALQQLEKEFGRRPKAVLNEPRPLDLDIIAFGAQTRSTTELTIPHPRVRQRRFVLQPLSEIAPDLILPGEMDTVERLLGRLPPGPTVRLLD